MTQEIKMTSLEISELTGKRHSDVIRDIRKESEKLGDLAERIFALSDYVDASGKNNIMYILGKKGVMQLILKYDAVTRFKVVEKLEELEEKLKHLPQLSEMEMIAKIATSQSEAIKRIDTLEHKFDTVLTLESHKQRIIQKAIAKRVYERYDFIDFSERLKCPNNFFYDNSIKPKNIKKLFLNIHRELKNKFGVTSYKDIKVVQYEDALLWINNWIEDAGLLY